ncbi:MAG TPA: BPSS1780 family membrane protein [Usitatibacter sp.]|jgi:hypothetical protein|nr:BPSS1780 family membrane protein [Usitatibacter sp.]
MSTPADRDNPFAPPRATLEEPPAGQGELVPEGLKLPGGRGGTWIADGWRLFLRSPGVWIVMTIIFFVLWVILTLIPFLGAIVTNMLFPVFIAGIMIGCQKLEDNQLLNIGDLFAGFSRNAGSLLLLGLLYLAGFVVIMIVVFALFGASFLPVLFRGGRDVAGTVMPSMMLMLLALLVGMLLAMPLYMAIWFAPALVVFHDMAPVAAMRSSFRGCLHNLVPFLLYGVILFVLAIVASIPVGLGWLVLAPVIWGSLYASYRDVFLQPA